MFSHFFIERPIFSSVISLLILLAGAVTFTKLPVAQFPDIVPPVVNVKANYSGADAKTLSETVAIPIEQQINGVDDMIYMSSSCGSSGTYSLDIYFEVGTDPDMATVNVQNRVALAEPNLPEDVKRLGVSVKKRSTNMLGFYCLREKIQKDAQGNELPPKIDDLYLSNYASIFVKDELARIHGVGEASLMDSKDYSIRVWLNPDLMAQRNLSVQEIASIIREQNVQVVSGSMGAEPVPDGQVNTFTILTKGRLADPKEFENLVVRTDEQGRVLKLKDIARVELGKSSYSVVSTFNGRPSATLAIYQSPGANAIDVVKSVNKKIEELQPKLAESGLEIVNGYDATRFIEVSIEEVEETLIIAIFLVIGVVYIFLQDWRAALIPIMTIPVSLVGCFFLMLLLGFSINTLTMFGLVLVIGIVVDDAIVVVENTQRILNEESLSPKDAAKKSMLQVSGPIVATTCVLCSVFIPTTFIGGMTGMLYTQFALTIAGAVIISALCALTISPALCSIILRKETDKKKFFFFRWFNRFFDGFSSIYGWNLSKFVRLPLLILILWFGLVGGLYWAMTMMPSGFIPNEDQGVLFVDIRLPEGASLQRSKEVQEKVEFLLKDMPGKENTIFITGFSMLEGSVAPNLILGILKMKDWNERSAQESVEFLQKKLIVELNKEIPEAYVIVFAPPPITGIGTSGGLECELLDNRGAGSVALFEAANDLIDQAKQTGVFSSLTMTFDPAVPQLYLNIDREKAKKMGLKFSELFATLQTYLGSMYVNDFNTFERIFHVVVQADGTSRQNIDQILSLPLLSSTGEKLPLRSIATIDKIVAPRSLNRFNLSSSVLVTANLNEGQSSGVGMKTLEEIGKTLPEGFMVDWTGMSYQERQVGSAVYVVFFLAMIFGFLVLAAQYESWSAPIIIMMAVPLGVTGAISAVALRGLDINIYTQIGLILMVGLSAKNAILITEFARDNHLKEKKGIVDSAVSAGKLRLRPIMMTSFAFILGVVPLAIASGAGANSRQAIGTAVCGGMFAETMVGILVTPVLFILLTRVSESCMKFFRRMLG